MNPVTLFLPTSAVASVTPTVFVARLSHQFSGLLAQSYDSSALFGWALVLIVLLVGGFMAAVYVKKWLSRPDEPDEQDAGFTLGDLRRLHQEGRITAEEFEKARAQMIAATQRAANRAGEIAAANQVSGGLSDVDKIRARTKARQESLAAAAAAPLPLAEAPDPTPPPSQEIAPPPPTAPVQDPLQPPSPPTLPPQAPVE